MNTNKLVTAIRQIFTPPLIFEGGDQMKVAAITYLAIIPVLASPLILIPALVKDAWGLALGTVAVDAILVISILIARKGFSILAGYLIPVSLFCLLTYLAWQGYGFHDITMIGFPLIVAMGGLMQGRFGVFLTSAIGTLGLGAILFGDLSGQLPIGIDHVRLSAVEDFLVITLILWITAAFIYFASRSLTRSLESLSRSEKALREANLSFISHAAALEQRTALLLTAAQVSRAASSILAPDELSQQVVDLVCERFQLYYVGLFLVDDAGEWAVLHAATGAVGKQMLIHGHRLKVGSTSMIGWCIANKKARIALDVGSEAVRFDNPLLPGTHSELALPLISRGEVIGALSIQSDREAAFSDEDILTFQAMGDQLANSIRNAKLYDQLGRELAQRKRAEKEVRKLNKELENRVAARTEELRNANQRLQALGHLKDEFLSNVSHELRTPITSIMLHHSMIERTPTKSPQYIPTLKRETKRLANLIESLLYLSRLDQDRIQFNPTLIDLNHIVQEIMMDREPMAAARQLTLSIEPDKSLPPVPADEQMISQVVSVLLTNAMNYTPANGQIRISTQKKIQQAKEWVGLEVRDTGLGITPEDRARLFERFFRGQAGRESAAPGTGLGLSIAHEIIEKHKGLIEVHSEGPGRGASFCVWLPAA